MLADIRHTAGGISPIQHTILRQRHRDGNGITCSQPSETPRERHMRRAAHNRLWSRLPEIGFDVHRCPAHIHQVGAGTTLERVQPLVHFRYTSLPCLPDPSRLVVPTRPGVVRAAFRPPEHLLGQAALSFTGLLRQPGEAGLSPVSGYMAPHGARPPRDSGRR